MMKIADISHSSFLQHQHKSREAEPEQKTVAANHPADKLQCTLCSEVSHFKRSCFIVRCGTIRLVLKECNLSIKEQNAQRTLFFQYKPLCGHHRQYSCPNNKLLTRCYIIFLFKKLYCFSDSMQIVPSKCLSFICQENPNVNLRPCLNSVYFYVWGDIQTVQLNVNTVIKGRNTQCPRGTQLTMCHTRGRAFPSTLPKRKSPYSAGF